MSRKNRPRSSETAPSHVAQSNDEVHFLAQALDYYRAVQRAGKEAPFGQFLNHADAAVTEKGRELLRQSLKNIVQSRYIPHASDGFHRSLMQFCGVSPRFCKSVLQ